jgi:hypothetical protein
VIFAHLFHQFISIFRFFVGHIFKLVDILRLGAPLLRAPCQLDKSPAATKTNVRECAHDYPHGFHQ